MSNQQARYVAMLKMVRDKLKFESNSPGGIVASIDAVIADASTVEQDALGGKPSQEALPVFTTFEKWWERHCGPIGLIPTKRTPEKRHAQQAWDAALDTAGQASKAYPRLVEMVRDLLFSAVPAAFSEKPVVRDANALLRDLGELE